VSCGRGGLRGMTVDVVEEEEEGRADWRKVVRSDRVCAGATGRKEGEWLIARREKKDGC
jgi:hypothetical protein